MHNVLVAPGAVVFIRPAPISRRNTTVTIQGKQHGCMTLTAHPATRVALMGFCQACG